MDTVFPRLIARLFFLTILIFVLTSSISAQQPFVTDDADVTRKRRFHLEFSNQIDERHSAEEPYQTDPLRLNGGILFSGNQTAGAVGIKTRGTVFTGGGSLVRTFTPRLDLGVEVVSAFTKNFDLGKGQLQMQVGGNYSLKDNVTFDFGIVAGRHAASRRFGVQLGMSIDW
ncbi:MAG TPA: hypothetical protein VF074_07335 [Pyrinomonadaceae bacterium]